MTKPDNEGAFHELVRQRLAAYQPPFDGDNWQRMRRKLRRDRWRRRGWWLAGLVILVSVVTYVARLDPTIPVPRPAMVSTTRVSVKPSTTPVDRATTRARIESSKPTASPVKARSAPRFTGPFTGRLGFLEARLGLIMPVNRIYTLPSVIVHSPDEADIIRRVMTGVIGADSTTYRVLSRQLKEWPNAVIVCDFTSSMYPYSTQLMSWFQQHATSRPVKGIVFFTDCDSLGRETGPEQAGQVFATSRPVISEVLPLMLASARNTMGNRTDAENNIAPLLYAQQHFPTAEHLVLIADNSSAVKDVGRVSELRKPVHIILCGPTYDTTLAFQPDYLTIARQTGGSLHTLEDDLPAVTPLRPGTWIEIDRRYYRLNRRGRFVLTGFRHRPTRLLGLFWH